MGLKNGREILSRAAVKFNARRKIRSENLSFGIFRILKFYAAGYARV